ncbi:amidohydrolase family protein [Flavobacterium rhizosphaerae]|uniref:Amidohydrolase family protein n=1 Tax=Flavobacterium rhizosphaerae TaxID=3163298 RepID=A0ABW8YYN3_9FLAO
MQQRIDSHQHFWKYNPTTHDWIDETMHKIKRDFMPEDLQPLLKENSFSGCVAVQADQTEEETKFLLSLANSNSFIKGVVGWVNLLDKNVADRLRFFSTEKKLKGFRHVVQGEPDGFMLGNDFKNGIKTLTKFGYTYDILIYHHQLPDAITLANLFPNQPFVIDHIAKPNLKTGNIKKWKEDIKELARAENVMCKVSGMVTEAHWDTWTIDDFTPCLDVVFENFTPDRIMFGSDWPVCNVAASYTTVVRTLENYISALTPSEQERIWFGNAKKFYNLEM